jgi:hypothetical protein
MFKGNVNRRKINPFKFKEVARAAFKLLKIFFIRAPILIHFNPNKSIKIETNTSKFAITGILSQPINKQSTSNPSIYRKLKNDNFKNLNLGKSWYLTIEKKSKHSQTY